jgi:phosphonate transport system ATP-binding protein
MGDPALRLRDASFGYASRPRVVTHIDLEVNPGQTVAIVGPSGGGKSTLLKGIVGLLAPQDGRLEVLGHEWPDSPQRGRVGYIPQRLGLLRHATALENAVLGGFHEINTLRSLLHLPPRAVLERAHAALEAMGLSEHEDASVKTLSGGQQRRVAVARAIVQRPDLLVADEFLGELDPYTSRVVLEHVKRLQSETGMALLIVEHDLGLALDHADDVHLLRAGGLRRFESDKAPKAEADAR